VNRREWADLVGLLHAGIIYGSGGVFLTMNDTPMDVDVAGARWIDHLDWRGTRRFKRHRQWCTACRWEDSH
jgi:hypothetical protein